MEKDDSTYIVANSSGEITAAASLMLNDYSRRGRRARFRIFHADAADVDVYQALLEEILPHAAGMDRRLHDAEELRRLLIVLERVPDYRDLILPETANLETKRTENRLFRSEEQNSTIHSGHSGISVRKGRKTPVSPGITDSESGWNGG